MHSGNFNRYFSVYSNRCTQRTEDDRTVRKVLYAYDRAGNRTGREEQYRDAFSGSLHTAVTTYTYDGMGRLTGEELDGKLTGYSYDMTGNRLSRTTEGRTERYHYNSRNQLTELDSAAETVQQEYDHAGNLTAESHIPQGGSITKRIEYTYDAYDRNTSVCSAGCVQQNHYDAEGLRNAVTENGSTTNFVYRNGMLSSELDADRNPVRGYVYGNEYISQNNGSSSGYYLNDEQGSIRYLTGSDGSIRNHYRYSAFGESITAEETVPNRLKYNAQMADELTGLYYLRARYYNASLGRFTQEDVIYNDGLNLYAYCNSNPVMYSDPSGFAKETCKSKVGGECDSESGSDSVKNWKGQEVKVPDGHIMSPRDPSFSAKPITEAGPYTLAQRDAFLAGNSAGTKLAPHHRHQIPVRDGGVIDELPGPGHPSGNQHTAGSPSRHPAKSIFNSERSGNVLRVNEITQHWIDKGNRLIEVEPGVWIDPGFQEED